MLIFKNYTRGKVYLKLHICKAVKCVGNNNNPEIPRLLGGKTNGMVK